MPDSSPFPLQGPGRDGGAMHFSFADFPRPRLHSSLLRLRDSAAQTELFPPPVVCAQRASKRPSFLTFKSLQDPHRDSAAAEIGHRPADQIHRNRRPALPVPGENSRVVRQTASASSAGAKRHLDQVCRHSAEDHGIGPGPVIHGKRRQLREAGIGVRGRLIGRPYRSQAGLTAAYAGCSPDQRVAGAPVSKAWGLSRRGKIDLNF